MPPKAKITREMIIEAAFDIVRREGADALNARTVAARLSCSTQPVMYHFKRMDDLKKAVYLHADGFHTAYITDVGGESPVLDIGLRYIRFAAEDKQLFRFLFQSDGFCGRSIDELIDDPELMPVLSLLSHFCEVDENSAKELFRTLFLLVHGYASMYANNSMQYDEKSIANDLERAFDALLTSMRR